MRPRPAQADGRSRSGAKAEPVVPERDAEGYNITLTPAECQKRYGWKNDPKKARLLKLEP